MIRSVEAISVPYKHLLVDDDLLIGDVGIPRHDADPCLVLSHPPGADLLPSPLDAGEHQVSEHRNPMHTSRSEILDGAIVGKVSIRSQTLKESQPVLPRLFHIGTGMILQHCSGGLHRSTHVRRTCCPCHLIVSKKIKREFKAELLSEFLHPEDLTCSPHVALGSETEATCHTDEHALRKDVPASWACQFRHALNCGIAPACEVPLHEWVQCFLVEAVLTPLMWMVWSCVESRCCERWLSGNAQERSKVQRPLLLLRQKVVHDSVLSGHVLEDQGSFERHDILPLVIGLLEHGANFDHVRRNVSTQLKIFGSTLPGLVLFPFESGLGELLLQVDLETTVPKVAPEVLRFFAIIGVNQDCVCNPVLTDHCPGHGFHQAYTVMKRRLRVNGHTEGTIGARPRIFPLNFPGCKPGHVHVSLAGRGTGENTTTYDRLERCPRRVVV